MEGYGELVVTLLRPFCLMETVTRIDPVETLNRAANRNSNRDNDARRTVRFIIVA